MNEPVFFDRQQPADAVRASMREASDVLKRRGNLALLTTTLLFCLLVTFTWFTVMQLVGLLFDYILLSVEAEQISPLLEGLWMLLSALLFLVGVMPAWLGRLRMTGLLLSGDHPMAREVLYYYTSPRRMGRAILMGLFIAFEVMLPAVLSLGAFVGALALYNEVLVFYLPDALAVLALICGFLLAIAITVLLLFLSGLYLLSTAIAVGNESMPVWKSSVLAKRICLPRFCFRFDPFGTLCSRYAPLACCLCSGTPITIIYLICAFPWRSQKEWTHHERKVLSHDRHRLCLSQAPFRQHLRGHYGGCCCPL